MEIEATQPSTLPLNYGAYSAEEYDDVLCILQPASQSAIALCHGVWRVSPQFILQYSNAGLRADGTVQEEDDLEMIGGEDTQGPSTSPKKAIEVVGKNDRKGKHVAQAPLEVNQQPRPMNLDIALRTSTPVRDVLLGFTFGREGTKSDIVLYTGGTGDQRISGMHFRIYLNQFGFLMLEDTSTNGITVDGDPLGKRYKNTAKAIYHGTTIDLVTNVNRATRDIEHAKFIVKLPSRNDTEYRENLHQYMMKIGRHKQEGQQTNDGAIFPKPAQVNITGKLKRPPEAVPNIDLVVAGTKTHALANGWTRNGKYRVISEVGKGAFAMVYKIIANAGGEPQAVKRIDRANFMKNGIMDNKFLSELTIMQKIDHPHVIHFHDYDLTTKHLFIIMEYMPYGDLAPYAIQSGYLGLSTLKSITRQLLHALAYIHRNGIVHRDIKPENVLVQSKEPFLVKLSDFGLSKMIEKEDGAVFITFCGTLLYCAPEIYPDYEQVRAGLPRVKRKSSASKPYSSAVDIWSLGTVMYHLLASKPPFKGSGEEQGYKMLRAVICDELNFEPLIARGVDNNGVAFFNSMIDIDGELRPPATELLRHPWMQDVPDIITIPNLEESQIVGNLHEEQLESLKEEDEWDKSPSESFIKAARGLVKTPTPEAPSLTTAETSADDKVLVTENDNSEASSQVDVDIGSETTSHIATTDLMNQGSARWEDDSPIGSGQSTGSWYRKPRLSHYGKGQAVEPSPSASEEETPRQARPNRLFGEISQNPSQESGVFGADLQPAFHSRDASPASPSPNSPSLFGAESRMNNLNMKGSRVPRSILRSAVTNSMLNGKRYRSSTADGSDESNTSSFEEPAAKRSMIRLSEQDSPEESFNADLRKSIDITKSLSQKVDDLQIGTRLATLTPLPGCLSSTEVLLTTRLSTFGRAAGNTNVYEDPTDSRIPRSAFDVYFFSPGAAHLRNQAWHKEPNLQAVVMTRCSAGIKVNGTRIPPSTAGNVFKIAQLRTGDTIEVYNSGRNKLVYRCDFHVSDSQYTRGADEPVVVEDNTELYQAANNGLVGQG